MHVYKPIVGAFVKGRMLHVGTVSNAMPYGNPYTIPYSAVNLLLFE
jgi:hypothetical protein